MKMKLLEGDVIKVQNAEFERMEQMVLFYETSWFREYMKCDLYGLVSRFIYLCVRVCVY